MSANEEEGTVQVAEAVQEWKVLFLSGLKEWKFILITIYSIPLISQAELTRSSGMSRAHARGS